MKPEKKKRICVTLPPETIEELKTVRQEVRLNISNLLLVAWTEYYKIWLKK